MRRRTLAFGLRDDPVQRFGHAGGIAHLFLIANHVLEQLHLFDFLEPALPDRLVGSLRGDQQKRRVVPVGGLDRRHKVGDAGAVLGNHHRHLAGSAGVAIGHHARIAFMCRVPERNPRFRKQVRNRHHG